jgi:hypothetical protein
MNLQSLSRLVVASVFLILPGTVWAQSSITGTVRDSSGGVLPGVTVEAGSPVLIGGSRATVTDEQGLYRIVDLRPGPYAVTFTLAGFNTLKRDGIDLRAEFTATVNADMSVGTLEETVTVSGQAPLVDIRSSGTQTQFQRETIEALPGTGRLALLNAIIPGANLTSSAERSAGGNDRTQTRFSVHGAPEAQPVVDGINQQIPGITIGVFVFSQLNIQEVVAGFAGDAEADFGGTQLKMVPRDGGNNFTGTGLMAFSGSSMEAKNITDELLARNLNPARLGSLKKFRESGLASGGPIRQNKMWFYVAAREGVNQQYVDGVQWNALKQPASLLYAPDFSRRVNTNDYTRDLTGRVTWQVAPTHKVVIATSQQPNCNCRFNLLTTGTRLAPEAGGPHIYNPNYTMSANWTNTVSNRFLIEAGHGTQNNNQVDEREPGWDETQYRITDQGLNLTYGNVATRTIVRKQNQERFVISYLTGSHQFRTGVNVRFTTIGNIDELGNDGNMHGPAVNYQFRNGVPNQLSLLDAPWNFEESTRDIAFFAQDQWTMNRLTLNLGARFNDARGSTPLQVLGAGKFVPERRFEPMKDVPAYKNLSPRLGAAYDLFGSGRTALKASLGHYPDIIRTVTGNPAAALTRTTNRTWNDANQNYVPDCDLRNTVANGECGAWSDLSFGRADRRTQFSPGLLEGFNRQYHNWQGSMSLQQELTPKVALNVGYFRTWYGGDGGGSGIPGAETNLTVIDNLRVTPADYNEYCVTAPADRRLPGGGGNRLCGLYDLRPALFGQVDNVVRSAEDFGRRKARVYSGVDLTVTARFGQGGQLSGGTSIGRTTTDDCVVVDSPQDARDGFCKTARPWKDATDVKFLVVYPLPWGISTSAVYQNGPGIPIAANLVVANAAIAPSLGRNLAACGTAAVCNATVTVPLIPNSSMFENRHQQVDLRFSRSFQLVGRSRLRANLDVYNVLNAASILATNTTYGAQWLNVTQILNGRLLRVGAQWDF